MKRKAVKALTDEQRLERLGKINYRGYNICQLYDGTISIEHSIHIIQRSCSTLANAKSVIDLLLDDDHSY